ncbi:hypothetical protein Tco_0636445, partial [Tanacetum coccineum]
MHEGLSPQPRQLPCAAMWTPPGCHVATVDPSVDWQSTIVDQWITGGSAVVN